ncbi:MAG: flavin reductase family protein [Candidatus Micrarchaeota archaeon]|nr:flavin reductase family protein [Candidatus Micrarchaeota archaeon]
MDLGWGNPKAGKWATNVGLITSDGPNGPNIMAAEWTFYLSYSPAIISVHIGGSENGKATAENIMKTKEFGVSLAASDQNVISSIAGGSSGREVDKIAMLKEMGIELYKGKKINALMVKGAATNAECHLLQAQQIGDHVMLMGEVMEIDSDATKEPLVYSGNKYYHLGEQAYKPAPDVLEKIAALKIKYTKKK